MAPLASLLLATLRDPLARRRMIGRLRPRLVGRPHPIRRLARLRGPMVRPDYLGTLKNCL